MLPGEARRQPIVGMTYINGLMRCKTTLERDSIVPNLLIGVSHWHVARLKGNNMKTSRSDLSFTMWFEQRMGMTFKLTVSMKNATEEEILELARANWDYNVEKGCIPKQLRP